MQNGIEFFTATCLNWTKVLEPDAYKTIITDSLRFLVEDKRISVYGFVIMPNHIHLLWAKQNAWLDKNVTQMFLKYTAQQIKFKLIDEQSIMLDKFKSTQADRDYHFWERRPFVATMNDREVLLQKLEYIHKNPVKTGLAHTVEDYKYSSARFYQGKEKQWTFLTHYSEHI
jgi:REP element-mobilizing transposase RayT